MMPESLEQRCWAEIDLAALERNLARIRSLLPRHVRYVAVVKADAYGHGYAQTVTRLMQSGVHAFAVANVNEGAQIREIGSGWPILVLGPTLPHEDRWLIDHDLTATLSSHQELERFEKLAQDRQRAVSVHLKIDTGMGRAGVWHEAAGELIASASASQGILLKGVYTHFSSADTDPAFTRIQRARFLDAIRPLLKRPATPDEELLIHADNSAGLDSFDSNSPYNAVRIGLLQFGCPPYAGSLLEQLTPEPVLSFHARLALIKSLPAGTPISYNQTHRLSRETTVGIVTAGYGDGLQTASSNRAFVLVRGKRCPVLGRITMDQTIIDLKDTGAEIGDRVTFIGKQGSESIPVQEFSRWNACIPWEALSLITKRVPRIYRTALQ